MTPDTDDVLRRLAKVTTTHDAGCGDTYQITHPVCADAITLIRAQAVEIERLKTPVDDEGLVESVALAICTQFLFWEDHENKTSISKNKLNSIAESQLHHWKKEARAALAVIAPHIAAGKAQAQEKLIDAMMANDLVTNTVLIAEIRTLITTPEKCDGDGRATNAAIHDMPYGDPDA